MQHSELADAILAHLVIKEPWMLRRMQTTDEIHRIDPDILKNTVRIASDFNKENRMAFHVVCDFTTAVQIGDLIRISFDDDPKQWEVMELKEGRVNKVIGEVIAARATQEQSAAILEVEERLGQK